MKQFTVIDAADQQFGTILNNRRVTIRLRYNVTTERWSIDLAIDDQPVLHGQRIVLGVNLIGAYDLGIGAIFAVANMPGAIPDRNSLPNGLVRLYWASDAELEAAV